MTLYENWVGKTQRVRAFTADGRSYAEGVVIAYAQEPTVTIRMDSGEKVNWVARLCESVNPPCRESENGTGVTCGLREGHLPAPHEGVWRSDDGPEYDIYVRWPEPRPSTVQEGRRS